MVFNAIFNNISVILWWSVLLAEDKGKFVVRLTKNFYLQLITHDVSSLEDDNIKFETPNTDIWSLTFLVWSRHFNIKEAV